MSKNQQSITTPETIQALRQLRYNPLRSLTPESLSRAVEVAVMQPKEAAKGK